jgi:hypothetical protein
LFGELTIVTAAPDVAKLSLLFQFWIVQSFFHASWMKKSDVASAFVAFVAFEINVGGVAEFATFL